MNATRIARVWPREAIAAGLCCAAALTPLPPLAAAGALLLLVWLPGRLVLRLVGLLDGDRAGPAWSRAVLTVACGLAVTPIALDFLWRLTNHPALLLAPVALTIVLGHALGGLIMRRERGAIAVPSAPSREAPPNRRATRLAGLTRGLAVALCLLVVFATVGSYWPTGDQHGPRPAQIHDFIKHHAVLFSLERQPLPLGDPFFAPDAEGPAYYYHYFYLIPATLRAAVPGVSIQLAFGIQAALVGLATVGLLALLARRLAGSTAAGIVAAALATAVGGLDLIPLAVLRLPAITLDAWADPLVRVHNLLTQMVWAPQHIQAILVALLAAYVLERRGVHWRGWLAVAPLLATGVIGSSVWVAAVFLPAAALLVLSTIHSTVASRRPAPAAPPAGDAPLTAHAPSAADPPFTADAPPARPRGSGPRVARTLAGACLIAALTLTLSAPLLTGYADMADRLGKGLTLHWPHQAHALFGRFAPPGLLANLLDLPWLLVIELGAPFVLALLAPRAIWRRAWAGAGTRMLLLAAAVALGGFVTVRSHFQYNDFGQKAMLAVQVAAVVLGAGAVVRLAAPGPRRAAMLGLATMLIALGLPLAVYQTPLATLRRFFPADGPLSRVAMPEALRAAREAPLLRFVRDALPPDAVIQPHWSQPRLELLQMTGRPFGAMVLERDTMVFQASPAAEREMALAALRAVLEADAAAPTAVHQTLRALGVTHVIVGEIEQETWRNRLALEDTSLFERVFESAPAATRPQSGPTSPSPAGGSAPSEPLRVYRLR